MAASQRMHFSHNDASYFAWHAWDAIEQVRLGCHEPHFFKGWKLTRYGGIAEREG